VSARGDGDGPEDSEPDDRPSTDDAGETREAGEGQMNEPDHTPDYPAQEND
jgi:hypothetical protein